MRDIKFRAWDKLNNELVKVQSIDFINNQLHFFDEVFKGNPTFIDSFELMQYTGLKDKNGKEIYEGDFLDYGDGIIKEVYWCQESCSFCTNGRLCTFHFENIDIYVVGNIYEHKHLIDNN